VNANNTPGGYVIGVDFGTLSGRALVVRVADGAELGTAVHEYRHGVMDTVLASSGRPLPPDWALQDPEDYRDVLRHAVPAAVADAGIDPAQVIGIGADFTACTVLPVLADGTPCEFVELRDRPTPIRSSGSTTPASRRRTRINGWPAPGRAVARPLRREDLGQWQFAKALQLLEEDPDIYRLADRWIEAADWIIWQLTGTETRNACTAGYKGIFQDGHYPSREFLAALHPDFAGFVDDKLAHPISALGGRAGSLTPSAAVWTGLPSGIAVAVGNVDAHVTPPAANAVTPGQMIAIMGTSTCHVMNGETLAEVPGMRRVDGGILADCGARGGPERVATFASPTTSRRRNATRPPAAPGSRCMSC
jgi:L-ribulokinase